MKFATALSLLQIAAASSGVAAASSPVGLRGGAAADAPEPQEPRHRALEEAHAWVTLESKSVTSIGIYVIDGCLEKVNEAEAKCVSNPNHVIKNPGQENALTTAGWCVDRPYLKIAMDGVQKYDISAPAPLGSSSGLCSAPGEKKKKRCNATLGSSTVCPFYIGAIALKEKYDTLELCKDINPEGLKGCNSDLLAYELAKEKLEESEMESRNYIESTLNWLQGVQNDISEDMYNDQTTRLLDATQWLNAKKAEVTEMFNLKPTEMTKPNEMSTSTKPTKPIELAKTSKPTKKPDAPKGTPDDDGFEYGGDDDFDAGNVGENKKPDAPKGTPDDDGFEDDGFEDDDFDAGKPKRF